MFTGIVQAVRPVAALQKTKGRLQLDIELPEDWRLEAGESVSICGVCLTVVRCDKAAFRVEALPETVNKTNLGALRAGALVNVERALRAGDPMGGHWVQGHIDGTGEIRSIAPQGDAWIFDVAAPAPILRHIVAKGSITVDGVSLTVVGKTRGAFRVMIIPFTMKHSLFGIYRRTDRVNLECDILAKYIAEYLKTSRRKR